MKKLIALLTSLLVFSTAQAQVSPSPYLDPLVQQAGVRAITAQKEALVANARAAADYTDALSFIEPWSSLSSWVSQATPGVQVSGGNLYSTGTGGGASSTVHSFPLTSGETARIIFTINQVLSGSGQMIVGVSSGTAGGTPPSAATDVFGISFQAGSGQLNSWSSGTPTAITGAISPGGALTVEIVVDLLNITVSVRNASGSFEAFTKRARSGFTVNNLAIFNNSSLALTGSYVDMVGARKTLSTLTPRTGLEDTGATTTYTGDGTYDFRVMKPAAFDSRKPVPVVICFHGLSTDVTYWYSNGNMKLAADAFVAAGWVVIAASYPANLQTWGNATGIAAYRAAYRWARDNLNMGPVAIYANSMGGIESLNAIQKGMIPAPQVWVGSSPTFNLLNNYNNAGFTSSVTTAYGISGGNYSTVTAGYDPSLVPCSYFGGIPMMILTASDDVTVDPVANGQAMATAMAGCSIEVNAVAGITGGHSFSLAPYTASIVAFITKYVKN